MSNPSSPPAVDYAMPGVYSPPSSVLFVIAIGGWAIAAGGGLFPALAFAVSSDERYALGGLGWLFVGGAITLAAFVCGLIYASQARACHHMMPHTPRRAFYAAVLPASNVLLAILLVIVGIYLLQRASKRFELEVHNDSLTRMDRVSARFEDGTVIDLGAIAGGSRSTAPARIVGQGRIVLNIVCGDRSREQVAVERMDADDLFGSGHIVKVDAVPPTPASVVP